MDCYFQIHTQNMRNLGESMHSPFLRCVGPEGEVGVELQEDGGWRTFNTHPRTHQRPDATTAGRDGVRDTPVEVELLACAVSASSPAAALRERTREEVRPERERGRERGGGGRDIPEDMGCCGRCSWHRGMAKQRGEPTVSVLPPYLSPARSSSPLSKPLTALSLPSSGTSSCSASYGRSIAGV